MARVKSLGENLDENANKIIQEVFNMPTALANQSRTYFNQIAKDVKGHFGELKEQGGEAIAFLGASIPDWFEEGIKKLGMSDKNAKHFRVIGEAFGKLTENILGTVLDTVSNKVTSFLDRILETVNVIFDAVGSLMQNKDQSKFKETLANSWDIAGEKLQNKGKEADQSKQLPKSHVEKLDQARATEAPTAALHK